MDGMEDVVEAYNRGHRGTEWPVSTKDGQVLLGFSDGPEKKAEIGKGENQQFLG